MTLMAACTIAGLARVRQPAHGPGLDPEHEHEEEEDGTEAVTSGAAVRGELRDTTSPLRRAPEEGALAEQQRRSEDVDLDRVPAHGKQCVPQEARSRQVRPGDRTEQGVGAGQALGGAGRQEAAASGVGRAESSRGGQRSGVSGEGVAARVAEGSAAGQGAERVAAPVRQEGAPGITDGPRVAVQGQEAQAPGASQQQQLEEEEGAAAGRGAAKREARAVREQARGQSRPPLSEPHAVEDAQQPQPLVALPHALLPEGHNGPQQDVGSDSGREDGSEQTQQQQQPDGELPAEEEVEEAGGGWADQGPSAHAVGAVPAGATVAELQAAVRELQLAKARLEVALGEERAAGVAREQQLLARLAEAEGRAQEAERQRLQALLGRPCRG